MNKELLNHASSEYKRTMNFHIRKFKCQKADTLRKMHRHDPKSYWKYLKSLEINKDVEKPNLEQF